MWSEPGTTMFRLLGLLTVFLAACAHAGAVVLAERQSGDCRMAVESGLQPDLMMVRTAGHCALSENDLSLLLEAALPQATGSGAISVSLGRLVKYPWLMKGLVADAAASAEWDAVRGRARDGKDNLVVARLLMTSAGLSAVRETAARKGYRIAGVSVEKVLAGTRRDFPSYIDAAMKGRLPFDAQVWIRLDCCAK